jgi:hypothetical protein
MAKQNSSGDGPGGNEPRGDGRAQAAGALAGEPGQRPRTGNTPWRRRLVSWLTWWVLMMALWVAVDDSFESDELLVGAGVAAFAALAAELVSDQAGVRFAIRAVWLARTLELPGQVVQQTVLVFAALARTLFTKAPPPSGRFKELTISYGDETPLGVTRRVLLIGAKSLAPNEFVLGLDADRDVMVTHQLVEER